MKKSVILLLLTFCVLSKGFSQADSAQTETSFLPLLVMNFDADIINKNVRLQWSVNSNEDVKSFEIERTDDGKNFQKIGGKLSTGKEGKVAYEFVDALPKKNTRFSYRIKILAKDGSSVYSNVRNTRINDTALECRLKQNPVRQAIEVEVVSANAGPLQASVFTNYGQKVLSEAARLSPGSNLLSFSSQTLLPGLHRLVLETATERKVISFVKE